MSLPFPESYWVVPGKLLAGSYPGDIDPVMQEERLKGLIAAGVTLVVDLMEKFESNGTWKAAAPYGPVLAQLCETADRKIKVVHHPIVDFSIPTEPQMREILATIRTEIAAGGVVYVHCFGGLGRTGTVTGCYLADEGRTKALKELAILTAHNPYFDPTPHTPNQRKFVSNWKPAPPSGKSSG